MLSDSDRLGLAKAYMPILVQFPEDQSLCPYDPEEPLEISGYGAPVRAPYGALSVAQAVRQQSPCL